MLLVETIGRIRREHVVRAGHPLALQRMNPDAMLAAMVVSFRSDEAPLAALIERLIELK
jgi:hypothetical protein